VVLEGGGWDKVSTQGKDLLRKLLSKDPSERPSATQVLEHSWLLGGAMANKTPLEDAGENLRRFHRGRRRLKALLLATMLGLGKHAECGSQSNQKSSEVEQSSNNTHQLTLPRSNHGDDELGSRLAALAVFDKTGKGVITGEDLGRVVRSLGDDLSDAEILEVRP
jgi:serine/threonine protein kinase